MMWTMRLSETWASTFLNLHLQTETKSQSREAPKRMTTVFATTPMVLRNLSMDEPTEMISAFFGFYKELFGRPWCSPQCQFHGGDDAHAMQFVQVTRLDWGGPMEI
jgi:hypothetical protein